MARPHPTKATAVDEALERLYGAGLSDFVPLRKEAAVALRAGGDRGAADVVLAARKPSNTAWAINQVARDHPEVLQRYADAVEALRAAQQSAVTARGATGASSFAAARAALNEQARAVIRLAREAMASAQLAWNPGMQRRIAQTLNAVPFAAPEDLARLIAGRLDKDLDVAADFGALAASLGPAAARPAREPPPEAPDPEPAKKDAARARREAQERAREEKARAAAEAKRAAAEAKRLEALEARAVAAEKEAERLDAVATQAEAAATRARVEADAAKAAARAARRAARSDS